MFYKGAAHEKIELLQFSEENQVSYPIGEKQDLTILWNESSDSSLRIDGKDISLKKNQLVCLTEFHFVEKINLSKYKIIRFNRPFYCVIENDSEVGCKGILFFGASHLPILNIPPEEEEKFEILWKMFSIEMQAQDDLKLEMLKTMLKRLLILCTRLYKQQSIYQQLDNPGSETIREFNFLVEQHYRSKHTVAEYADLMNKSAKTIANLFSKIGNTTPLQLIHDRKMLEARRLLRYTDTPIKEIAYSIGFEDIQAFSRFFKNIEGCSPTEFKELSPAGKIANK